MQTLELPQEQQEIRGAILKICARFDAGYWLHIAEKVLGPPKSY